MAPVTLAEWLSHAERQHVVGIDLGLERVTRVARAMGFEPPDHRAAPQSVIVAGTNGKGSTSVFVEALLRARGRTVGTTLSPHVHRFNERVRLHGEPVDDATLCDAFAVVERARGAVPLTYFEYAALVALEVFRRAGVDFAVLEVGLGGRLDAFNLVGADVAVVTSIGLDHQDFLGHDLEQIGREKAGVMRPGRPVVIGSDVTTSVPAEAARLGCPVIAMGADFQVRETDRDWSFDGAAGRFDGLPWGALAPYNCALAIAAAGCLEKLTAYDVRAALAVASLPGRCEAWQAGGRLVLLDVAHNPAGAAFLGRLLRSRHPQRRFVGLLGMLADKDTDGVVRAMAGPDPVQGPVRHWICVSTSGPRGQDGAVLATRVARVLADAGVRAGVETAADIAGGLAQAHAAASGDDGILAFGSFNLVEGLRNRLAEHDADGAPVGRPFAPGRPGGTPGG